MNVGRCRCGLQRNSHGHTAAPTVTAHTESLSEEGPRVHRVATRSPGLLLVALLLVGTLLVGPANAACTLSACTAGPIIAACCSATTCALDGTITVSGPSCTFDFGARSVTLSGQLAAQGKTVRLQQKSLRLTGLIDVRGPGGAAAGNVTIVTTGMTGLAYSQEGGGNAIIDASSTGGPGGNITFQADGSVAFSKGSVKADGGTLSPGGIVSVSTTSGDVSVQISISASSRMASRGAQGHLSFVVPGNVNIGGSGRLIADLGAVLIDARGTATFADGSVVQANLGGEIAITAAQVQGRGEMRATGESGSISLETTGGPLFLSRLSQGLTVGNLGQVTLTTAAAGDTLTIDAPILANGAIVEVSSGGALVVSRKIDVTGVNLGDGSTEGGGEVTLEAAGDVQITRAIVGSDPTSVEGITIDAQGNVIVGANLEMKGSRDADGGDISIAAGGDITVQGDTTLDVSGADNSSAGSIELDAGQNVTVTAPVTLIADGSPIGAGGAIFLQAGLDELGAPRLAGNVLLQGDVKANGHAMHGSSVVITGCNVSIPPGAVLDVTGDQKGSIDVTARTSLTIGGTLRASAANVLTFSAGSTPTLIGSFIPARSAGTCGGGTVTADGCARTVCSGDDVPAGCLYPCPQCGNNQIQFPETCDIGIGAAFCAGLDLCDRHCRVRHCEDDNPCTVDGCDATAGCTFTNVANGMTCNDATVCNGLEVCQSGACRTQPGSLPNCVPDTNPCTSDTCDPVAGCVHPPLPNGSKPPGCLDADLCNGTETCVAGQCQAGTPTTCPPGMPVCDAATGQCRAPNACSTDDECTDGNPCTSDACIGSTCSNEPVANGTSCDDGDACNGIRTCQSSSCLPGTPLACDDDDPCTGDSCDPSAGCKHDRTAACCRTAADCDDGSPCTGDSCVGNVCQHGAVSCADDDVCTNDGCDPQLGCQHVGDPDCCQTATDCTDDGEVCTDEVCVANRCQHIVSSVCCTVDGDCRSDPDNNPCTDNGTVCPSNHRCTSTPLDGPPCGSSCDPATCQSGTCVAGPPTACTDDDPCTTDVCTDIGCAHVPIGLCCQTTGACTDDNVCTNDTCDLDAGRCVYTVPDVSCDPCRGGDPFECGPRCHHACVGGRCQEVTADCDDGNPCTDDTCDAATGCVHTPLAGTETAVCDDDDPCTDGDSTCIDPGRCEGTPKTGFASIDCRLQDIAARLSAAQPENVNARLKGKLQKRLDRIQKKLDAARRAEAQKCKQTKRLLKVVARALRGAQKSVNRVVGRRVDSELGTAVAARLGEAAAHANEVRNGLGC
jgi:hypothetical protein